MSTVPAAPPIKYVLGYWTLTLNPNPITDPNPKNKRKQKGTGIKFNIKLHLKVNFVVQGVVINGL